MRPSIEFKPELETVWPDRWIARFGDRFAGKSGATPAEAMVNFDIAWGEAQLPPEPDYTRWLTLGLTRSQARMLDLIVRAGPNGIHRDRVLAGLYSASSKDWPQHRTLDVFATKIRQKLKAAGSQITIESISGFGWRAIGAIEELPGFMGLLRNQRNRAMKAP